MTEAILNTVCNYYNVTRAEIAIKNTRRQKMQMVIVKHVAAYFLHRHTELSYSQIGRLLGYPGRQNVYESRRSVKKITTGNRAFKAELETIDSEIMKLRLRD